MASEHTPPGLSLSETPPEAKKASATARGASRTNWRDRAREDDEGGSSGNVDAEEARRVEHDMMAGDLTALPESENEGISPPRYEQKAPSVSTPSGMTEPVVLSGPPDSMSVSSVASEHSHVASAHASSVLEEEDPAVSEAAMQMRSRQREVERRVDEKCRRAMAMSIAVTRTMRAFALGPHGHAFEA
ncbi:hypothetical protein PENSPDRAFT_652365 [Peniophora sp. CONT]|nr:hypothetical protein PENSPDRAFT_652365 [Peniophora sp. CONT]